MNRSISTINADVAQAEFGASGEGIVWAIIGSGVESGHVHFQKYQNLVLPEGLSHWETTNLRKIVKEKGLHSKDLPPLEHAVSIPLPSDVYGHGTSFASLIAGEHTSESLLLRSMAPKCKLMSIKVTKEDTSEIEELDVLWALRLIQVVNKDRGKLCIHGVIIPLEMRWDVANFACGYSPICVEVDRLVNSGVVVVASAGNRGYDKDDRAIEASISDPGNAPNAITVGSTHRFLPKIYGASFFSSKGPTADGRLKPDLIAPGEKILTCKAGILAKNEQNATGLFDGTSYAAAHVAGAIASLLSVRPQPGGRSRSRNCLCVRPLTRGVKGFIRGLA